MPLKLKDSAPATVNQLVDNELVHDVADLYTLKAEEVGKLDRMGPGLTGNLMHHIEHSKDASSSERYWLG